MFSGFYLVFSFFKTKKQSVLALCSGSSPAGFRCRRSEPVNFYIPASLCRNAAGSAQGTRRTLINL
jgi:hypothetical protein